MKAAGSAKRWMASAWAVLAGAACCSALAAAPEQVEFASLDSTDDDKPLMISAYLYKPAGDAPFPMIVLFHGCGGVLTKSERISSRFSNMASMLNGMGYGVLLPDSFNPRGQREICTTKPAKRAIRASHRAMDAYGALAYLDTRDDVVPGKVAAIGFSHGGTNALQVVDANLPEHQDTGMEFAASVSLYPGCAAVLKQSPEFAAYAPLLMLVGELDDWTPARHCQQLAERSRARGEPVEIVTYPDAHHGFDLTSPVRVRTDVTHGTNGAAGVHVGGNPAARDDAYRRIREFFAVHLGDALAASAVSGTTK